VLNLRNPFKDMRQIILDRHSTFREILRRKIIYLKYIFCMVWCANFPWFDVSFFPATLFGGHKKVVRQESSLKSKLCQLHLRNRGGFVCLFVSMISIKAEGSILPWVVNSSTVAWCRNDRFLQRREKIHGRSKSKVTNELIS
jgi:hypothetical protein